MRNCYVVNYCESSYYEDEEDIDVEVETIAIVETLKEATSIYKSKIKSLLNDFKNDEVKPERYENSLKTRIEFKFVNEDCILKYVVTIIETTCF